MMDYTKPIATRTRGRYDEMYKIMHEEMKRKQSGKATNSRTSESARSGCQPNASSVEAIEKSAYDHLDGFIGIGCKPTSPIRLDDSDDEVVITSVCGKVDMMEERPFVSIDDSGDHYNDLNSREMGGSKGFNFVEVKAENVVNETVSGFDFGARKNRDVDAFDEIGGMNFDGSKSNEADGSRSQPIRCEIGEDDNGSSDNLHNTSKEDSSGDDKEDDLDDNHYQPSDCEGVRESSSEEEEEEDEEEEEEEEGHEEENFSKTEIGGMSKGKKVDSGLKRKNLFEMETSTSSKRAKNDVNGNEEDNSGHGGQAINFVAKCTGSNCIMMESGEKKMNGNIGSLIFFDEMEMDNDSYNIDDDVNKSCHSDRPIVRKKWRVDSAEGNGDDGGSDKCYDAGQANRSKKGIFGCEEGTVNMHAEDFCGRKPSKRKQMGSAEGNGDDGGSDNCYDAGQANSLKKGKFGCEKCTVNMHAEDFCVFKPTVRKQFRTLKNHEVIRILANSILENVDVPFEEKIEPVTRPTLPLVFTFGVEKSLPPEKSEEEKQMDALWAELNASLYESVHDVDADAADNATANNEADVPPAAELDQATLCGQGHHEFALDEEIGFKCIFCSYVHLEIKYHVAPFHKNPWGRSERRDYVRTEINIFEHLHHQDSGCESLYSYDPCVNEEGTVWDIIPGIGKGMHPHQREGFEFLWKNIVGSIYLAKVKETTNYGGNGCVISHAPGTGKTRLTIAFLQSYMKLYPTCRPVVIAPSSMLLNWEAEFQKWRVDFPFHNLNDTDFSGKENKMAMDVWRRIKIDPSPNSMRMVKLYSWKKDKSILGVSYSLFRILVGKGNKDQMRKVLLELPGLIILDEGHRPRNDRSLIWKALLEVQTEKRIILSGTPFQNNLDELFNTLYLVRPKFGDSISSQNRGAFHKECGSKRKWARENWANLTNPIGKLTDGVIKSNRLKKLRELIAPFVHVHKGTILQQKLPGLRDCVIILRPDNLQKILLDGVQKTKSHFRFEHELSLASVHPSLLSKESLVTGKIDVDWTKVESLRLNPEIGIKTKFLMELIRLSWNERVLVFSQYIDPLNLIVQQLQSKFHWVQDREILYMHGQISTRQRHSLIKDFNNPISKARVLLASTRACGEGISLVGASRVVLLDVVWNPSVERQAISRAYRLEQEKVVYVYHLIASETMEEDKYWRQAQKEQLSELVFYSAEKASSHQKTSSNLSDDKKDEILERMVGSARLKKMFKKIIYQPRESNAVELYGLEPRYWQ